MKDSYSVEEVEGEPNKNIAIRLAGEDISFQASGWSVSIYISEDIADKIAFQIQSILQDRERRKEKT